LGLGGYDNATFQPNLADQYDTNDTSETYPAFGIGVTSTDDFNTNNAHNLLETDGPQNTGL